MPSLERPAITNTVINVSPYDLGKAIGGWNSEEQALVLQGLSDQLRDFGTLGASHQVSNVIQDLNGSADYLLELLAEYAHNRAADKDRYDLTQASPERPVPWEVVQGRVTFPAPVIPAEAWDKARGITPGEPIMDEAPAEETDR